MEEIQSLGRLKERDRDSKKRSYPYPEMPLEYQAAINMMGKIADSLPLKEVNEWCTEWLLAYADIETIADFIVCAMASREYLELAVEERSGGDEE